MKRTFALLLFAALLLATACLAQTEAPPGNMRLLPGYLNARGGSIDSEAGTIAQEGGLSIQYDIGPDAGDFTNCKSCGWTDGEIWRKRQVINGHTVVIVFTKENLLVVSFPKEHANFHATIKSESQMADMLLMVFTYNP